MIDLIRAKELVREWLDPRLDDVGVALDILDDEVEEHDWGWVIPCGPVERLPAQIEPNRRLRPWYVVDRLNGHVLPVGTYGMNGSVFRLLRMREKPGSS